MKLHPQTLKNKENPALRARISSLGVEVDGYADPHYGKKCIVCGQSPCVQFRRVDNDKLEVATDMCGPCTFGEAACINPEEW
jgi:hypothetical protein